MPEVIVNIAEALSHTDTPLEEPELVALPEGRIRKMRTNSEMWQRRMEMAAMQAKGKYRRAIAKHFGCSVQTVSNEIHKLVSAYREQALKSISELIAEEEALIYMVQLEAIQAWFESKQGKISSIEKRVREIRAISGGSLTATNKGRKGEFDVLSARKVDAQAKDDLANIFGDPDDDDELASAFDEIVPPENGVEESYREDFQKRHEESAGDPRFLQIVLECSDRRAKLHALYPSAGSGPGAGGRDDDETLTPVQRVTKLRSLIEKAQMKKATQLAIIEASHSADAVALKTQPESLFEQRAKQLASAGINTEPEKIVVGYNRPPLPIRNAGNDDLEGLWEETS